MSETKTFNVRWPKSKTLVGQATNIVSALAIVRLHPGTAVYRVETDSTETAMSIPAADAPKEPQ